MTITSFTTNIYRKNVFFDKSEKMYSVLYFTLERCILFKAKYIIKSDSNVMTDVGGMHMVTENSIYFHVFNHNSLVLKLYTKHRIS